MIVVFLHLGEQISVFDEDIIAILSIDALGSSELGEEFLKFQKSTGKVTQVDKGRPKSIIITSRTSYLSPISPSTLYRRHAASYQDLIDPSTSPS